MQRIHDLVFLSVQRKELANNEALVHHHEMTQHLEKNFELCNAHCQGSEFLGGGAKILFLCIDSTESLNTNGTLHAGFEKGGANLIWR